VPQCSSANENQVSSVPMTVDPAYGLQLELKPKRPRWGPWATLGWGVLIVVVYSLAQTIAALIFVLSWNNASPHDLLDLSTLESNGPLLGVATLASTAAVTGIIWWAAKLSRIPPAIYLALRWPSRRNLLIGLAIIAVMLPLTDYLTAQSGQETIPEFMTDIYLSSQGAGPAFMVLLAITLVVLAPLSEEFLFRGFLYRGFANGFGPFAAILLTALIWASIHVQYSPVLMGQIFVYGLVLGWIRWRSGSLIVPMVLHGIINLLAMGQVAYLFGI
jgi:membrane protease YdiL (CAAX protease family)